VPKISVSQLSITLGTRKRKKLSMWAQQLTFSNVRQNINIVCNHPNDTRHHLKCYVCIRENGGWDCYEVIPVEFLKLENNTQLVIAEQAEIDKQDNLKNSTIEHI
jgi:hypothetical protein